MWILKTILIFSLIIVGVILIMYLSFPVIGRFLRKKHVGQVVAVIDRPLEDVWKAIIDFKNNPVSARMCKGVIKQLDDDGTETWTEDKGSSQVTIRVVSKTDQQQLIRELVDETVSVTATCEVSLESTGDGCRVTARNSITVEDGNWQAPVLRCMFFFFGHAKKEMKFYVIQLANHLETKPEFS